MLWQ
jgi:hypothetical protein